MTTLREKLANHVPVFGLFQSMPSPVVGEILGNGGADFVIADIQHGALTWDSLLGVVYGIEAGGASALVRVGWNDPPQIMRALDLGARGVIVPMVSTAEEARGAASAAAYGPAGIRSIGPVRSPILPQGYSLDAGAQDPLCIVMIETRAGLANLEEIARTPGVDGLFLGQGDLSLDLGLGLSSEPHERIVEAIDAVVEVAEANDLVPGTVGFGQEAIASLVASGMQLIAMGSDRQYLGAAIRRDAANVAAWAAIYEGRRRTQS